LDIITDNKMTSNEHADIVYWKSRQIMLSFRKFKRFHVNPHVHMFA